MEFDITKVYFSIVVILFYKLKSVSCAVTCRYYPYYPTTSSYLTRTCTYYCCSGYPTTSSAACCSTTTRATTTTTYNWYFGFTYSDSSSSSSDSWVIPVAVVCSLIGLCLIVSIGIGVACAVSNKKRRPIISPNYTGSLYPTTTYPNPTLTTTTQYPTTTINPYSQLNPNPFNQFPQPSAPPKPSVVNNQTASLTDEPPRYDSIVNQPSIINVNSDNQPVLPAPIGFNV